MKTKLTTWGNSLGIRIPKYFALQLDIEPGSTVEVELHDNRIIIYKAGESLETLLHQITADNLHGETCTVHCVGKEVW